MTILAEDIERRRRLAREALGQRILGSRYWAANGRAVSAVAVEVDPPGGHFSAYLAAAKGQNELEDSVWTARYGSKLNEREARSLFPGLGEWRYWP